jgi:hypothetical protein
MDVLILALDGWLRLRSATILRSFHDGRFEVEVEVEVEVEKNPPFIFTTDVLKLKKK